MVKTVHRILDSASCRCGYGERESEVVELNFYFRGMWKSLYWRIATGQVHA
jgi:hypothetical protein